MDSAASDGKIARATKRTKDAEVFGIQIDSLCDLVSFGVLPSAIGHAMGITGVAMAVLMFYTLCAVIRLGYFNVTEQKRQETTSENRTSFEGLPVTWSAPFSRDHWLALAQNSSGVIPNCGIRQKSCIS